MSALLQEWERQAIALWELEASSTDAEVRSEPTDLGWRFEVAGPESAGGLVVDVVTADQYSVEIVAGQSWIVDLDTSSDRDAAAETVCHWLRSVLAGAIRERAFTLSRIEIARELTVGTDLVTSRGLTLLKSFATANEVWRGTPYRRNV